MSSPVYFPPLASGCFVQSPYNHSDFFDNVTTDTPSGKRYSYNRLATQLGRFEAGYTSISNTDLAALEAFFVSMQGRYGSFTFIDPGGNMVPVSEDFTNSSWAISGLTLTGAGGCQDPFGGTLGSRLSGTGTMIASVLPAGFGPSFWMTASIWVLPSAAGQSYQIGFWDGTNFLAAKTFVPPAGAWTRISTRMLLATASPLSWKLSASMGPGSYVFGAMCSPLPAPGPYVRSPEGYAIRNNCRFDTDSLDITYAGFNRSSVRVAIKQHV